MLRRRHINADPTGRIARPFLAVADAARWPFERLAWALERRLLWPLRERTAGWGLSGRGRIAGAAALAAVAVAAVLAGALLSDGNGGATVERVATTARVASDAAPSGTPAAAEPQAPALHGIPPSFGIGKGVGVGKESSGAAGGSTAGASAAASAGAGAEADEGAGATAEGEGAATASSAKPAPAGPAAMKVARRFAEAFVFYEIGERPARVRDVFGETATPHLAGALEERPPRLPERARVPKAKVVNLVPGPRRGKDYTVSVSLLRVGLTSELRITLQPEKNGEWKVSEVLG
jgi:hypothetical protein